MPCCDCDTNPRGWQQDARDNHRFGGLNSGYGYWNGSPIYYEFSNGKVEVFAPNPFEHNHDHAVLVGADVTILHGTVHISGGTPTFLRVDAQEIVNL